MASPKFAWGIDIGNRALKAIRLVREGDRLRVDDVDVIEHEQILSNAGDNRDSLVETSLAHFVQRHPAKGGTVAISVSGQASFARFIKLPPVEDKKIPEIVQFEAIQQIPFPLDEVEWSYQLFREEDSPDVEVGIFAMRKELIDAHLRRFTSVGMNVQTVQMNPLAVYNAMYYDERLKSGTTMVIDMGAENTDLIISQGETVWLRNISVGGNNFTEALAKAFKVPFAKAEELKRGAATSKYARKIFQEMRPVFADLVTGVQQTIGFYASGHSNSRISRIIALGGTFRLPTLQKYLQQNLQIKVETLDGLGSGAPDDARSAALLADNLISMVGPYGLAIQAMGDARITSSLLPQEIRTAKLWKEKTKWFGAAAALFVVGGGLAAYSWYNQSTAMAEQGYASGGGPGAPGTLVGDDDQTLKKGKDLDSAWDNVQRSGEADRQRILNVNSMQKYRDLWPAMLADLTRHLPQPKYASKEELLKTPRDQRDQLVLESVQSRYEPDIAQYIERTAPGGPFAYPDSNLHSLAQPQPALASVDEAGGPGGTAGRMPGGYPTAAGRGPMVPFGAGGQRGGGYPIMPIPGTRAPASPADPTGAAKKDEKHGFIITLHCTSPNKDAHAFVDRALFRKLLDDLGEAAAVKGQKPYYVARTLIVREQRVADDDVKKKLQLDKATEAVALEQARKTAAASGAPAAFAPGVGGMGPPGGGPRGIFSGGGNPASYRPTGGASGAASNLVDRNGNLDRSQLPKDFKDPLADPITGEDTTKDYQFTLLIFVGLDPEPPKPVAGTPPTNVPGGMPTPPTQGPMMPGPARPQRS